MTSSAMTRNGRICAMGTGRFYSVPFRPCGETDPKLPPHPTKPPSPPNKATLPTVWTLKNTLPTVWTLKNTLPTVWTLKNTLPTVWGGQGGDEGLAGDYPLGYPPKRLLTALQLMVLNQAAT
jgi:hypothetical protein